MPKSGSWNITPASKDAARKDDVSKEVASMDAVTKDATTIPKPGRCSIPPASKDAASKDAAIKEAASKEEAARLPKPGCCSSIRPGAIRVFSLALATLAPILVTVDQVLDGLSTYKLDKVKPSYYFGIARLLYYASLTTMCLPVVVNYIMTIQSVLQDTEHSTLKKILLVPALMIGSPFIQTYYLVMAAYHLWKGNESAGLRSAERAGQVKLVEALLEAFPQAIIQLYVIHYGGAAWWQYLSLVSSLLSLSLTVSTSAYLFGTAPTTITKATFFSLGIISASARLLISSSIIINGPMMLVVGLIMWCVKMCGCCCWCCRCCLPLSPEHRRPHHVVLTLFITVIYNSFTTSGLVISTLTVGQAGWKCYYLVQYMAAYNVTVLDALQGEAKQQLLVDYTALYNLDIQNYNQTVMDALASNNMTIKDLPPQIVAEWEQGLAEQSEDNELKVVLVSEFGDRLTRSAIMHTLVLSLSLVALLGNLIVVLVPRFRRHIGDKWLHITQHNDNPPTTKLY